jgi:hypothetical protein
MAAKRASRQGRTAYRHRWGETIAVHARSYDKADFIYNPLHYRALVERKCKALDQAAHLVDWQLAECIHRLRRLG